MASIHKLPGRNHWYALFRDANGIQRCRSTRILHSPGSCEEAAANEAKALVEAQRMQNEARAVSSLDNVTIRQWITKYAAINGGEVRKACLRFVESLDNRADEPMTAFSRGHFELFLVNRGYEMSDSYLRKELSRLREMGDRALSSGMIAANPFAGTEYMPASDVSTVKTLLLATSHLDWRTAIYLGFYTGAQTLEATRCKWSQLQADENGTRTLAFPESDVYPPRLVAIHPVLDAHLCSLPNQAEFICPSLAELEKATADLTLGQISKAAKMPDVVPFGFLRRVFSSLVGVPFKKIHLAEPAAALSLPKINVPRLPCQIS